MSVPGILHQYVNGLVAFEFQPQSSQQAHHSQEPKKNVIVFVGGLGDGLLTVPYVAPLAASLEPQGWGVVQILISSSYKGWGTGSLRRDAKEIGQLVRYLRSEQGGQREKIVLVGHSTGTQDVAEYITKFEQEKKQNQKQQGTANDDYELFKVDGAVLQASVSDREGIVEELGSLEKLNELISEVQDLIKQQQQQQQNAITTTSSSKGNDNLHFLLPDKFAKIWFGTPITAYRFLSLALPNGDDDYFSSDLADSKLAEIFGSVDKPLLIAFSGNDEFVPQRVNKHELVKKWQSFVNEKYNSSYSGVIEGASHNVGPTSEPGAQEELINRISGFLKEFFQ